MKWFCAKTDPPTNTRDVLVSDGYGGYAVGWYSEEDGMWYPSLWLLKCCDPAAIAFDTEIAEWRDIGLSKLEE
jgi:hypothetical protein